LGLINDILDLSKIEAGHLEVDRVDCAAHLVINEVVAALAVKAAEKGVRLAFHTEGPLPATIHTDPGKLRQIVTNLIGNAIKFTQTGAVTVTARLGWFGDRAMFVINVQDSGIGIPQDRLESIFDPFTQAESSTSRRFGGTGLGLTISRRFARALGGDVVAQSQPGEGSTFIVTLDPGPVHEVRNLSPEDVQTACAGAGSAGFHAWKFERARVLVVDDGEQNRELVRVVLEEVGLEVEEAENGQVACELATREKFDAILMDMQMPVMDGFAATRFLRQAGASVPIVGLTAEAMKGAEQAVLQAGCSVYLAKPIVVDTLLQILATYIPAERREVSARNEHEQPKLAPQRDETAVVSRLAAHPRLRATVRKFSRRLNEQMAAMDRARAADDFDELCALGHWLKGAGGTVGYDAFTEPALELEQAAKAREAASVAAALERIRDVARRMVVPEGDTVPSSDLNKKGVPYGA
jgi:CheY-like chemotaxis protein